ncbi:MAG: heparinase II/III domain-containing protein [Kiritimatiellia bacterium]|jgi:hypothetical protein
MNLNKTIAIAAATMLACCPGNTKANKTMTSTFDETDLLKRLESLGGAHPRLGTRTNVLPADLGDRQGYVDALVEEARAIVPLPVLERKQEGRRLLAVSREALRRISTLSIAWMRTRDPALLARAEAEMLAVCAFSDWNPSHYLDVGEMSLAVALGYDWLHDALPADSRETIADGLWRLGLETALDERQWWVKAKNNWGQVCHAGMTAAALALAERHPDAAATVVARAFRNLPISMDAYAPDGVYPEGPTYWDYGTSFNVMFFILVESALGTSYGLDSAPGFVDSADFMRHATGATGRFFNFADCGLSYRNLPALLWFADRYPERFGGRAAGSFKTEWHSLSNQPSRFVRSRTAPLTLTFGLPANPATNQTPPALPRDFHGRGGSEIVTMRSAWDDSKAWYVGIKSGSPVVSHGHMDGGSFILEAEGVRWACEAGAENYHALESQGYNLWNNAQDGLRWGVFRYGNLSHNILVVNGGRQIVKERADVVETSLNSPSPHATVDLNRLYGRPVTRHFHFVNRRGLDIRDNIGELKAGDVVRWQMLTQAAAKPEGNALVLTQNGKFLTLAVDADVTWTVAEATALYQPWDTPQENFRVVAFERKAEADGAMQHTVSIRGRH